ncbi:hypothetical protein NXK88_001965 [Enterococcus hirae]|uniref:hypothetical protein n=1 Tax=Enterococcus hirae TaxID=1354 RepID=UPI0020742C2C|nr:hypothetical protein [Enterococcus hirae]EMF0202734.1 hypothetical protein [Enterococcus hirae]
MGDILLTLINLVLYFLMGYTVGIRKYHKKINAAINYDHKSSTCDYQEGWLDCLGFMIDKH